MATEGPERQPEVDEEFARIVAGWSEVASTSGSSALPPPPSATGTPVGPPSEPAEPPQQPHAAQASGADAHRSGDGGADTAAGAPQADAAADAGARDPRPEHRAGPPDAVAPESSPPWRGYLPDEPDEHFRPPEPQLPPPHDATYWLAVVGLVGGPLLVLYAVIFSGNADPGWSVVAGIVLTVAGFGLLVLRGSGDRDPDDDGSRV